MLQRSVADGKMRALAAGRDPDQITRLYNVMGLISDQDEGPFHGPPQRWVDTSRPAAPC